MQWVHYFQDGTYPSMVTPYFGAGFLNWVSTEVKFQHRTRTGKTIKCITCFCNGISVLHYNKFLLQGMKAVVSIEGMEKEVKRRNQLQNLVELEEGTEIIQRSWDCACTSTAVEESPDKIKKKEPLSAPFWETYYRTQGFDVWAFEQYPDEPIPCEQKPWFADAICWADEPCCEWEWPQTIQIGRSKPSNCGIFFPGLLLELFPWHIMILLMLCCIKTLQLSDVRRFGGITILWLFKAQIVWCVKVIST